MSKARTLKRIAIIYKGDKCSACDTEASDATMAAFVFHHIEPHTKIMKISTLLSKDVTWSDIKKELDKCNLMCANCHQIHHTKPLTKRILPI